MEHPERARALLVLGIALVAIGLFANDWLPTGLLSGLDGERYRERRELLGILSVVSIVMGSALALLRRPLAGGLSQLALVAFVSLFCLGAFVAGDIGLGYWTLARQAAADLRNADASPRGSVATRADPFVGWVPTPGSRNRHVSDDFDVVYETDEDGFRRIDNLGAPRRSLYVFGDSYAFGHGVADDATFTAVMRREMLADDVHIFNAALAGHGIIQMYARFLSYEDRLRPGDLVIMAPISDDLRRNLEDFSFVGRMIYHQARDGAIPNFPIYRSRRLESVSTDDAWLRLKSYFFLGRETHKLFQFLNAAITAPRTTQDALDMMSDVERRCRARGVGFALIFLPRERELRKARWNEDVSRFTFLSLWDDFPQGKAARSIRISEDDPHWNPSGHRVASGAIVAALARDGLLAPEDLR